MKFKSRKALMLSGALVGLVRPLLAADAKVDLLPALDGVNADNLDARKDAIASKVIELVTPHLAQDSTLDTATVLTSITAIGGMAMDEGDEIVTPVAPKGGTVTFDDQGKQVTEAPVAMDEATVQAKIDAAVATATAAVKADALAMDAARDAVFPHVGKVTGDSAIAIYKIALDAAVENGKITAEFLASKKPEEYATMVAMLPDPDAKPPRAFDAAPGGKLAAIVPNLPPVKVA